MCNKDITTQLLSSNCMRQSNLFDYCCFCFYEVFDYPLTRYNNLLNLFYSDKKIDVRSSEFIIIQKHTLKHNKINVLMSIVFVFSSSIFVKCILFLSFDSVDAVC